ncbi:sister chromatid cohesion protein DCC1 [Dendroctonus ponderosae]|uniref:Sister chromatid cohesion protein DCC1 n=1 Tax=Dendroctonus ponderosae TaxID=77166 RepID=J3JYR7_DENPD
MDIDTKRTPKEAEEILNFAKLSKDDLLPTSQALYFSRSNVHDNSFCFLQLSNELLKCVENHEPLVIKGCNNDDLVICSDTTTFHVTSSETSNNMLLVKPATMFEELKTQTEERVESIEVCGIFQIYLEAQVGKCSLHRLSEMLKNSVYKGPEYERHVDPDQLYTMQQLKNVVQASDAELLEALDSMDVIEIEGFVRELEFDYHFRVLSYMLKIIDENSWTISTVDYDVTCDSLKEIVPEAIIEALFKKYTSEFRIIDGARLFKYKPQEVCQIFARAILRSAAKFNLEEFLQAWQESVPEGIVTNEEMLYGIAIINRKSSPKVIWEFEEALLPDDINERLHMLFEAKDKWTVAEIAPYIKRLATNKLDVNALLAKYARASKVGGVKYYSAKHTS